MATKIAHIREATTFLPQLSAPLADQMYLASKRRCDIVLAIIALVLLAPLLALISCAIALDSRGPIIFRQKRVLGDQAYGDEHPEEHQFEFYKFRSMYHKADQSVHQRYVEQLINGQAQAQQEGDKKLYKLGCDPRVTRVGRILRKTSLDELPQLFNVLKGEMSLVGPRPAIAYEVRQYKPWHLYRLTVQQRLPGVWQVAGRNELSFDEMVQLDIEYAQRRSFWLDLQILFATIPAVLRGRGVC